MTTGAGWLLHCLPLHSPLVISSRPPLALLSCQLVFESPIVARPSRPLVTPPSRLLAAPAGCRIASQRPFVAPPSHCLIMSDGCCVASRHAVVSSSHRAALSSSRHYLTAPPSLRLILPAGCWSPLIAPPSCCPLTALPSHHLAPAGCCDASRCAAVSSSHCELAGCCVASIKRCRRHQMPRRHGHGHGHRRRLHQSRCW